MPPDDDGRRGDPFARRDGDAAQFLRHMVPAASIGRLVVRYVRDEARDVASWLRDDDLILLATRPPLA